MLSQKRRLLVHSALVQGQPTDWDYDGQNPENGRWFRGQSNYNEWAFDYLSEK